MSNVGAFIRLNIKLLYRIYEIAGQTIFSILLLIQKKYIFHPAYREVGNQGYYLYSALCMYTENKRHFNNLRGKGG